MNKYNREHGNCVTGLSMFVMFLIARVSTRASSLCSRDIEILKEDESASAISYLIVMLARRMYAKRETFRTFTTLKFDGVTNITILEYEGQNSANIAGFVCFVYAFLRLN